MNGDLELPKLAIGPVSDYVSASASAPCGKCGRLVSFKLTLEIDPGAVMNLEPWPPSVSHSVCPS